MRTRSSFYRGAALAAMALTAFCGLTLRIHAGEPAPKFFAKSLDGEKFTNESLKGRVVLLQFWTTWCSVCQGDQAAVETIVGEFANSGLVVLGVDVSESRKKVKKYLEESPRSCKIVLTEDTNLAAMFAAKAFPLYVLIDKHGNIVGTQRGAGGEAALRRLLTKAGIDSE